MKNGDGNRHYLVHTRVINGTLLHVNNEVITVFEW
jgi:hypothetical protein